jgi:hypothetical protein
MPAIYTDDWYKTMFELANSRDDLSEKVPAGEWKIAVEVKGDGKSPYIPLGEERSFYIFIRDGKVMEYHQSQERVPGKGLHYRIIGAAYIFEGIAAGILDPVEVGLNGSLEIRGDMRLLIQNAELVNVIFEVYTQSDVTEWPKGKPPYE